MASISKIEMNFHLFKSSKGKTKTKTKTTYKDNTVGSKAALGKVKVVGDAPDEYTPTDMSAYPSLADYIASVKGEDPGKYAKTTVAPEMYEIGTYSSEYADRINSALDNITNWNYDPMQDASYRALASVYNARGNRSAKNTMADAAALNGGYGTSYAASAAQQARNQYNQELAALIPDLEQNAYDRATNTYAALRDIDDAMYGRFRDTESDKVNQWDRRYQTYRDDESDNQWTWSSNYGRYRDMVGDQKDIYSADYTKMRDYEGDRQYASDFSLNRYQTMNDVQRAVDSANTDRWSTSKTYSLERDKFNFDKKQASKKGSSSGGGGRSGGGKSSGGGYSGSSSSGGGTTNNTYPKVKSTTTTRNPMDHMTNPERSQLYKKSTKKK